MHHAGIAFLLTPAAFSPAADLPSFEAASVKVAARPEEKSAIRGGPGTDAPGYIYGTSVNLSGLILRAYELKGYQFSYPPWMDDARFDLVLKLPEGASTRDCNLMMQGLLAERFHLKAHRESRTVPIYALRIAKGGPKLSGSPGTSEARDRADGFPPVPPELLARGMAAMFVRNKAKIVTDRQPLARFAEALSLRLGRPVLDRTNLAGVYSFTLRWDSGRSPEGDDLGESIFPALEQQLGLKLEAGKAPVEYFIVDSADRKPTGN